MRTSRTIVVLGGLLALGVLLWGWVGTGAAPGALIGRVAPEIAGAPWINSAALTTEQLRGRVVYVEFWTYG